MRTTTLVLCLVLSASSLAAQDFAVKRLDASPRHHEWVNVPVAKGRTVRSFVAYPERADASLAVVVIHENRGLTDWVRLFTDELAAAGYLAIAPDLLSGFDAEHHDTSGFADSDAARKAIYELDPDRVTADLLAVQKYVAAVPSANGKTVVVGFCWGGSQAFRFATRAPGLAATLVFYGTAPDDAASLAAISAPVYGFYGEMDDRIGATIPGTTEWMKAAGKTYEPVTYAGAGHAFMRRGEEPDAPPELGKARDDAWARLQGILAGIK